MTVTDDSVEEHGHHLPAVDDWPRGFGEASWWPFVTAVGGGGFYVGAALYVLGQGESALLQPWVGPAVFATSVLVFLAGLYGWLYHAFVASFWERSASPKSAWKLRWGMIAFLGSEIATFGALFVYYFFVRVGAWPPTSEVPHLLTPLVVGNTLVLILSSITMHYAHLALLDDDRSRYLTLLGATFGLGVLFLAGQVYEYYEFIVHEGFTAFEGAFSNGFYALTGLHGLHVSLGAVLLGIVLFRSLRGQYSADRHVSVSTTSMYWHFVDAVWVFLVVVLYAGAAI